MKEVIYIYMKTL